MIMEFCGGGELLEYIKKRGQIDEFTAREIFKQIVSAISYVHNRGVIHRDLKLENVLFLEKGNLVVKVVDFGIAGKNTTNVHESTTAGSIAYMPPEVISHEDTSADPAIDVWALGCILYAMLLGRLPFYGADEEAFKESICETEPMFNVSVEKDGKDLPPPALSKEVKDLIRQMLDKDPKKRATVFQIDESKWLELFDDELEESIEESKAKQEEEAKEEEERAELTKKAREREILESLKQQKPSKMLAPTPAAKKGKRPSSKTKKRKVGKKKT